MGKGNLSRKLHRALLNQKILLFSLMLVFLLGFFLSVWPGPEVFGYFLFMLALYFSASLAYLILEKTKRLAKRKRIFIILFQIIVVPPTIIFLAVVFVLYFKEVPRVIGILLGLPFYTALFTAAFVILKPISSLMGRLSRK